MPPAPLVPRARGDISQELPQKKKKNLSHSIYWVIKEQLAALLEAAFLLFGFARKIIPNPLLAQLFPL